MLVNGQWKQNQAGKIRFPTNAIYFNAVDNWNRSGKLFGEIFSID